MHAEKRIHYTRKQSDDEIGQQNRFRPDFHDVKKALSRSGLVSEPKPSIMYMPIYKAL